MLMSSSREIVSSSSKSYILNATESKNKNDVFKKNTKFGVASYKKDFCKKKNHFPHISHKFIKAS
jgi:predicted ester cyclase